MSRINSYKGLILILCEFFRTHLLFVIELQHNINNIENKETVIAVRFPVFPTFSSRLLRITQRKSKKKKKRFPLQMHRLDLNNFRI